MAEVRRSAAAAVALVLSACAGVYQPLSVPTEQPWPEDAFERCWEVLVARYGGFEATERDALFFRTTWAPMPDRRVAGQQRAVVRAADGGLVVFVEARYLTSGLLWGAPSWTSPRPAPHLERPLAGLLLEALER